MEIFLNGNKLDAEIEHEKTLHEVLVFFEKECMKNDATIVQIEVNGTVIPAGELDTIFNTPLPEVQKLAISTVCEKDIVKSIKNLAVQLTTICEGLEQISVKYQTNNDNEVSAIITSFANSFDSLCHLISLTALFPTKFSHFKIDDMTIIEFLQDFSPILEEFETALKEKDTVLVGDLAEYEIMPRLTNLIASIQKIE
ncbi:MAG TPA: hypothetical protein VFC68_06270 [Treponemataceae bacterium]|nr:hypothetical protein [Treponemataceae bacterium]